MSRALPIDPILASSKEMKATEPEAWSAQINMEMGVSWFAPGSTVGEDKDLTEGVK